MKILIPILVLLALVFIFPDFGIEIWGGSVTNQQQVELYGTTKLSQASCEKVTGAAYKRLSKIYKRRVENALKKEFKQYAYPTLPEGYHYADKPPAVYDPTEPTTRIEPSREELLALIDKRRKELRLKPYGYNCDLIYYIGL